MCRALCCSHPLHVDGRGRAAHRGGGLEPGPLRSQAAAEQPRAAAASKNSRPGAFLAGTNLPAAAGPLRSLSRPAPGALGTEPDRPSDRLHLPPLPGGSGDAWRLRAALRAGAPLPVPASPRRRPQPLRPPLTPQPLRSPRVGRCPNGAPVARLRTRFDPPLLRVLPAPGRARTPLRPADRIDLRTLPPDPWRPRIPSRGPRTPRGAARSALARPRPLPTPPSRPGPAVPAMAVSSRWEPGGRSARPGCRRKPHSTHSAAAARSSMPAQLLIRIEASTLLGAPPGQRRTGTRTAALRAAGRGGAT